MKSMARSHFWWPGLDKAIEELAHSCLSCQSVKSAPAVTPLHPWVWPTRPWQRVHVDFAGPFCNRMFLILVDAHSKWPEVIEMPSTSAEKTVEVLRFLFASYSLPEQLVSDNGPQFTFETFQEFMKQNGVKHILCSPYHPSSNGLAERFVRTFKESVKVGVRQGGHLSQVLANFLLTYRSTPHATTNESPSMLFVKRQLRTKFDLLRPDQQSKGCSKQADQKKHHDTHAKQRSVAVGCSVLVRDFIHKGEWLPGEVVGQLGPCSYLVQLRDGRTWRRHLDHLKVISSESSDSFDAIPPLQTQVPARPSREQVSVPRYPQRVRRPVDRYGLSNIYVDKPT